MQEQRHIILTCIPLCAGRPIPVMGYNRKEGFLDLMFPDFTYYGHEYSQIVGEKTIMRSFGEKPIMRSFTFDQHRASWADVSQLHITMAKSTAKNPWCGSATVPIWHGVGKLSKPLHYVSQCFTMTSWSHGTSVHNRCSQIAESAPVQGVRAAVCHHRVLRCGCRLLGLSSSPAG